MLRSRKASQEQSPADARVVALAKENERLRDLLSEKAFKGATCSGYLWKYRAHAESSLWANTWELRYMVLKGSTLLYYKQEQDVQFPPRGQIDLQGAYVESEGLKRRKYLAFNVYNAAGVSLIRLSSESQVDYAKWMEALERAGCERRGDDDARSVATSLQRVSGSSTVSSPTASGMSDSGEAAAQLLQRHSPSKLQGKGEDEVSSAARQLAQQEAHQSRGYTSDQSDVARQLRTRQPSSKGGHRGKGRDALLGSSLVHTAPRWSFLSTERIDFSNQNGLLTLGMIILVTTNARLILENILKYGLRFNPVTFLRAAFTPSGNVMLLLCWPFLGMCCLCALGVEALGVRCLAMEQKANAANRKREVGYGEGRRRAARQAKLTENLLLLLNLLNTTAVLLVPSLVMHITNSEPLPGFMLSMFMIVLWLKLVSYAHVNWDYRAARRQGAVRAGERGGPDIPEGIPLENLMQYPENITLRNLAYFLVAPTLCYQPVYPRSSRFRVKWLARRVIVLCFALSLMLFINEQYIEPIVENSLGPLRNMDWMRMTERILKLSLPTLYFWLSMFYALFHLWLNILAELTGFADREFYKEWWNATTLGEYWRQWNQPVHKWMLRHVYFPCIRHGISKFMAGIIVFFVSAVFHELVVGVPLHMLRSWSFWGIMGQVPLIWVTELLKKKVGSEHIGNMIFWLSFCFVGQPIAIILYYHDYRKQIGLIAD